MFSSLTKSIGFLVKKFESQRGEITQQQFDSIKSEFRTALLTADVSLKVVNDLLLEMSNRFVGQKVVEGVTAADTLTKLVNDAIVQILGEDSQDIGLDNPKSGKTTKILLVGLQGAGKTTTAAKLAHYIEEKSKNQKKVMLASVDFYRPAAREQLRVLCEKNGFNYFSGGSEGGGNEAVFTTTHQVLKAIESEGTDVLILDTAGRLSVDEDMMSQLVEIEKLVRPDQILLVIDAMIGRSALAVASNFMQKLSVTGLIFTKVDSDSRSGAMLSIRKIHDVPIKFLATGEKVSDFDEFKAERIAGRILGMGDIVSLVEKASSVMGDTDSDALKAKAAEGKIDLMDVLEQLRFLRKLGGLPFVSKFLPKQMVESASISEEKLAAYEAIILSMTKKERLEPLLVSTSLGRKIRIGKGSGSDVRTIEDLLILHSRIATVAKDFARFDKSSFFDKMKMGNAFSNFTKL